MRQLFWTNILSQHRRQGGERGQGGTQIVRREAQLAHMVRQRPFLVDRMVDRMRSRRQLGEEENSNKKEMAQRIHRVSLIDLNE